MGIMGFVGTWECVEISGDFIDIVGRCRNSGWAESPGCWSSDFVGTSSFVIFYDIYFIIKFNITI